MPKISGSTGYAPWRLAPGVGESRLTRTAKQIDSTTGNRDGKVSLDETKAHIKGLQGEIEKLKAKNAEGWFTADISNANWDLQSAEMVRTAIEAKGDTGVVRDVGSAIAKRTVDVLAWPFAKLLGSGNTPNFNTEF